MNGRILIFDFDGTIVDTMDIFQKLFNNIRHKYHLPDAKDTEFIKDLRNVNIFDTLRKFGFDEEKIEHFLLSVKDEYLKEEANIKPFPGIIDALKTLHGNGDMLVIVSSNHTELIQFFLKKYSMEQMFSSVLGGNTDTSKVKNIEYIINENNVSPDQIYYIGDTMGDINEAKEADVTTVGVTWGFHGEERIKESSPDIIIRTNEELISL